MHAGRPWWEFLQEAGRAAQAFPNFAGPSVGALGCRFILAFVPKALTQPAAKAFAAIKDAAAASTSRALKPTPRPAERCGRHQIPDRLADLFPRALCGTGAEGQLDALRKGKEAYGTDGLAIAGPFDHASVPRL